MKVLAALLALALLAQLPQPPPDDLALAVKYALALFVAWATVTHACNQTMELWRRIRGRQALPRGQREVTEADLEAAIIPLVDDAAATKKKNSERFRNLETQTQLILMNIIRLNTILREKGVKIPRDRKLEGDE